MTLSPFDVALYDATTFYTVTILLFVLALLALAALVVVWRFLLESPHSGVREPNFGLPLPQLVYFLIELTLVLTLVRACVALALVPLSDQSSAFKFLADTVIPNYFGPLFWPLFGLYYIVSFVWMAFGAEERGLRSAVRALDALERDGVELDAAPLRALVLCSFRGSIAVALARELERRFAHPETRVVSADPWRTPNCPMSAEWLTENARRRNVADKIESRWADLRTLECLASNSFDLVVVAHGAGALVGDAVDLDHALNAVHRVLKPGGYVYCAGGRLYRDALQKRLQEQTMDFETVLDERSFRPPAGSIVTIQRLASNDKADRLAAPEYRVDRLELQPELRFESLSWTVAAAFLVTFFVGSVALVAYLWPSVGLVPASLNPASFNGVGALLIGTVLFTPIGFIEVTKKVRNMAARKRFVVDFEADCEAIQNPDLLHQSTTFEQVRTVLSLVLASTLGSGFFNAVFWAPSVILDYFLPDSGTAAQVANFFFGIAVLVLVSKISSRLRTRRALAKRTPIDEQKLMLQDSEKRPLVSRV